MTDKIDSVNRYWKETGEVPRSVGECADGDYVLFSDYDAALAEIAALKAQLRDSCDEDIHDPES